MGQAEAVAIRSGFNGSTLAPNDDGSTGAVGLGFTANFFGNSHTSLFVNNNGNVTFDSPLSTFTPFDLTSTGRQIIAPFFADVDTTGPGSPVTYGAGTVNGRTAFGVNWLNVGHHSAAGPLNSFQLVLTDRSDIGAGDFDIEFNYDQILWEAGEASGSNALGLGGSSVRVGYSNGSTESFELAGSAINGAFLDSGPSGTSLINNSLNSNVLGRYVFNARNGAIPPSLPSQPVPEPSTLLLLVSGLVGLIGYNYRRGKQNVETS